jgi:hypothetical protein
LSQRADELGVRVDDPLLSLIATVSALETLTAEGVTTRQGQDVQRNARTALAQIAKVCNASLT